MTDLKDRLVLVTGAYRGIGAACARAFAAAARGSPAPTSASRMRRSSLGARDGQGISHWSATSTSARSPRCSRRSPRASAHSTSSHCAGVIHEEPLLETTVETFDRVIGINLRGSFLVGKGAIALMDGREGG